jgi:hypothetical protein
LEAQVLSTLSPFWRSLEPRCDWLHSCRHAKAHAVPCAVRLCIRSASVAERLEASDLQTRCIGVEAVDQGILRALG